MKSLPCHRVPHSILLLIVLTTMHVGAQRSPRLTDVDRTRLAEAFAIGDGYCEQLWRGWSRAPFAVLLTTPEYEFLLRHPRPSADFISLGYDSLLKTTVLYRARTQPLNLLATFPAVEAVITIVTGQAENTMRNTSTLWVATLLHEHFHQMQMSQERYFADVASLNLSRGDASGMWMLNYPFPYSSPNANRSFKRMCAALADALLASSETLEEKLESYLRLRAQFKKYILADDYTYFSFQVWQEGIARYTEYRIAERAGRDYTPSAAYRALKDYSPLAEGANIILRDMIYDRLRDANLSETKRNSFYAVGAAEGLLLDRVNPKWKERYFTEKFALEKFFEK